MDGLDGWMDGWVGWLSLYDGLLRAPTVLIIFHCLIGFLSILVQNYLCTYIFNCFSKMLRCVTPFKAHIVFKVNVCIRSISKFDIVVILQCSVLVLIQLLRFTLIVLRG